METNFITLAIPGFFLFILIELALSRLWRKPYYRLSDSIASMSTGVIDQLLGALATLAVAVSLYELVYRRFALTRLDDKASLTWILAFIGSDFFYYWWHRMSHEVNFLWATHVVHHQSQEYNLSTALRQTYLSTIASAVFYLPLAVLGVSPTVFFATKSFMILYQFWIHTRLIPKLGPIEWVFNTPSHHRVHHGINPKYVDRNYAGAFIVWDKLFGTFEPESEEAHFGTLHPLASWNPVWANFHSIAELVRCVAVAPGFLNKLRVLYMHPGWQPKGAEGSLDIQAMFDEVRGRKYEVPLSPRRAIYVLVNFLVVLGVSAILLFSLSALPAWATLGLSLYLIASLYALSVVSERRSFAYGVEGVRIALGAALITALVAAVAYDLPGFRELLDHALQKATASL